MASEELLVKVERLKIVFVDQATYGTEATNEEYSELRKELLSIPRVKAKLPKFVSTCRTLGEFWAYIKPKFSTYAERRSYLKEEFEPLLKMLEEESPVPGDPSISTVLLRPDLEHVNDAWQKALDRRISDPDGAITAARTLLETVCKVILDEEGVAYKQDSDLPALYKLLSEQLNLAPSQHTELVFKQILGSCTSVVVSLGTLRNRQSDAHGKSKGSVKAAPRHAQLAVNLAGSVATFLIETWEYRKQNNS